MLLYDKRAIGNKLLSIRKRAGLTQEEVAEISGLSNRTYADIERGTVNMRIETVLRICTALKITPDEILTQDVSFSAEAFEDVIERLEQCSEHERRTALSILTAYLDSLAK
jgi:transcriptional regulator with XRE-family HTH domain